MNDDRALAFTPAAIIRLAYVDLYGHLLPGSEAEGAELFDAYLARGVQDSTSPATSPEPSGAAV